jgi:two-component system NtrC family sensor kinase
MNVLVAEDDLITRQMLANMLTKLEHTVVETENGVQAWQLLQKKHSPILIADWEMPEMDGIELCQKIRQAGWQQYVYIIVLTARSGKEDLLTVFESGADDYITKPVDPDVLTARLKTAKRVINLERQHQNLTEMVISSRDKLRRVFDALQEEIVSIDRDHVVVSANKRFLGRVNRPFHEVTNLPLLGPYPDVLLPDASQELARLVEQAFTAQEAQTITDTTPEAGGEERTRQVTGIPIQDGTQALLVFQDITDELRKQRKIRKLNTQLLETASQLHEKNDKLETALKELEQTQDQILQSEKMASIGQLAAGVAHEINNPTGFVSSNIKTLADYMDDLLALAGKSDALAEMVEKGAPADALRTALDERRDLKEEIDFDFLREDVTSLLEDCRDGLERIRKIVGDLKDFAHPGEDAMSATDINKGLASTLNVVANEIKYKADVETDFGDLPLVEAIPQQLNQVFMNILVNAAQAIENRGTIHIATRATQDGVVITFSDDGCGIPEENLSRIFDPFFTTKEVGKGTGLGMNITYNIITKHNGEIRVESEVGKGTTFTIQLPLSQG